MTQRENHEARTDLYEKAKYWIEHPGMPDRPKGLHATTVASTPLGALNNVRSEIAAKEGTSGLEDGNHYLSLMSSDGSGEGAKKEYVLTHRVEDNRTAKNQNNFLLPSVTSADRDAVFKE
jgi:hypothetical protein